MYILCGCVSKKETMGMHIERGRLSIACVCMVLGFMLAVQFRTTQDIKSAAPLQRVEVLTERLQALESENEDLR